MARHYGDFLRGAKIYVYWDSYNSLGASSTPSSLGTVVVYKNDGNTEVSVGVSENSIGVDGRAGVNRITIDSSLSNWYQPCADYHVHASGFSVDGQFVSATVASFSIENRYLPGLLSRSTLSGGAANTAVFGPSSSDTTDYYAGGFVEAVDGPGAGVGRGIVSYATTHTASLDRSVPVTWTSATTVLLYVGSLSASTAEHADAILGRNIGAGSDGGRTVSQALAPLRNKVDATGSTGTVYSTDDNTSLWTFSAATAGFPFASIDPA